MNTTIGINNIPIDKQLTHYLVNGTTTSEFNYMQKQITMCCGNCENCNGYCQTQSDEPIILYSITTGIEGE